MLKITYQGHSCFILDDGKKRIVIDPFLNNNPFATIKPEEVKVDAILVTHTHFDHLGDAIQLSQQNNAVIIGTFELTTYCQSKGATNVHPMHIGGSRRFDFGEVKLTPALHGSGSADSGAIGVACGFLVKMGGKLIYHAGDTGLFGDMHLIGDLNEIDVAMVPIGDNFTMGIKDAVKAVQFLRPKIAIPMHYNTFDVIKADPHEFVKLVQSTRSQGLVLNFGETYEVPPK